MFLRRSKRLSPSFEKKKNKKKPQNNFNFKYLKLLGNLNTVDILLFTSLLNVLFPCLYLFFLFIFCFNLGEHTIYSPDAIPEILFLQRFSNKYEYLFVR